jgi:vacuolar-type H+-ATPase subunit H
MKTEIEIVMQADDDAQRNVEAARAESQEIRLRAQQQAGEILAQKREELARAGDEELQRVLSEAQARSRTILEEADRYLHRLEQRKTEQWDELINDLIKKVLSL